jgi:hypothetical protein
MLNRLVGDDWSHNVKHNVILRIQVREPHGDPVQVNTRKNLIRIIRGADLLFWRWFHRQGLRHFVSVFCLVAKWLFWALSRHGTCRKADCISRHPATTYIFTLSRSRIKPWQALISQIFYQARNYLRYVEKQHHRSKTTFRRRFCQICSNGQVW